MYSIINSTKAESFIQFHYIQKRLVWGLLRSIKKPKRSLGQSVDLMPLLNEDGIKDRWNSRILRVLRNVARYL